MTTNDKQFRIVKFAHEAQHLASQLRLPVALVACGLIYSLLLDILAGFGSALGNRDGERLQQSLRGEIRAIRRREDGISREEEEDINQ
jgi:hypothetical protein